MTNPNIHGEKIMPLRVNPLDPVSRINADFVRLIGDMTAGEKAGLAVHLARLTGEIRFADMTTQFVRVDATRHRHAVRNGRMDVLWTGTDGHRRRATLLVKVNLGGDVVSFLEASIDPASMPDQSSQAMALCA
jgi:hypothetical protein